MSYDALNRISVRTYPAVADNVSYSYDLLGRLLRAARANAADEVTYAHDKAGRITRSTAGTSILDSVYDSAGNRTELRLDSASNGLIVGSTYDALNRPGTLSRKVPTVGVQTSTAAIATYNYDDLSRLTSLSFANGATSTFGYDTQSLPASLNMDVAGTALDGGFTLARNQAGEVTQNALTNTVHQWRGYRNNLTDYSRNGLNQYTVAGPALSYDGNGDLIGDGTWSYSYNTDQQLTGASRSGLSATLAYDATGRLRTTVVAGTTTNLLYDGNRLVAETPVSGVRRYFVHGPGIDEAILQLDGDTPTYLHADYQGSIIATSNSAGTVGTLYQYGPYGEPDLNTGGRMRYTGQQWLGGLGLYYYKARMYSPALGRFLQTDPIGYRDDMNLYAYVGNNPINRTDPTGLYWFRQFWQTDHFVGSVQSNLIRLDVLG